MRKCVKIASLAVVVLPLTLVTIAGCPITDVLPGSGGTGGAVNLAPIAVASVDLSAGIVPLTVRFTSADSTDDGLIVSRLWDFDDGETSVEVSPTHIFQSTGVFEVTVTVTDDKGLSTTSDIVEVSVTEGPQARIQVDRTTAETPPATFSFDGSASSDPDGTIEAYSWDFGDGTSETEVAIDHTFARPGTYRVRLTVTDNIGVRGTDEVVIQVGIATPQIEFVVPPADFELLNISSDAPLWAHVNYDVEAGVPYTIRAGLDSDLDPCNAQSRVYDVETGEELVTVTGHGGPVMGVTYTPDGATIATTGVDGTIRIFDSITGTLIVEITESVGATAIAAMPSGDQIVYGLLDGTAVLRTLTGTTIRRFDVDSHTAAVTGIAVSPDGSLIATSGADNNVLLWDVATGTRLAVLAGHTAPVHDVAFSPVSNNQLASASADGTVRIWNTAGVELFLFGGHGAVVNAVDFAPDGQQIISGGDDDRAIIWGTTTGTISRVLIAHTNNITAVAFGPDATTVATGSADFTARIWDVASGETTEVLQPCISSISAVRYSPDGANVIVGVSAKNDIQLDVPEPNGNDLKFVTPQPLDIRDVAAGTYYLWAELDTDRTDPERVYANPVYRVRAEYPDAIADTPPRMVYDTDGTAVIIAAPFATRQIVDLGPLNDGDRIELSLLSQPGFGDLFTEELIGRPRNVGSQNDGVYSVMVLDGLQELVAWYQQAGSFETLFTKDTKLVVTHDSDHYYLVTDTGSSLTARVVPDYGATFRPQTVFVDFRATTGIWVGGQWITYSAFDGADYGFAGQTADIKNAMMARLNQIYAAYDITFLSSDTSDEPAVPHKTIYIGEEAVSTTSAYMFELGLTDFLDPRNDSRTGAALVGALGVSIEYPTVNAATMGVQFGNAAAYELGFLLGLRNTTGTALDLMDEATLRGIIDLQTAVIGTGTLSDDDQFVTPAIGTQDANQFLLEVVGPS